MTGTSQQTTDLINAHSHLTTGARTRGPKSRLQSVQSQWPNWGGGVLPSNGTGADSLPPQQVLPSRAHCLPGNWPSRKLGWTCQCIWTTHPRLLMHAESFKHKGGMGQLLSALQSKLTQSSRSRIALGMEAGVAEDRGLGMGRGTARTTKNEVDK